VWAHGRTGVDECPKSFLTPASVEFVEKYLAGKAFGACWDWKQVEAREAEAFQVLDEEWRREVDNGG
jgi:hypothetical protein